MGVKACVSRGSWIVCMRRQGRLWFSHHSSSHSNERLGRMELGRYKGFLKSTSKRPPSLQRDAEGEKEDSDLQVVEKIKVEKTAKCSNSRGFPTQVGENGIKLMDSLKLLSISTTNAVKRSILKDLIRVYGEGRKTIVFTRTKCEAGEIAMAMNPMHGCEALHGGITPFQREKTLKAFHEGKFALLVATDVAAHGLDVPNADLVIHYQTPNDPKTFVHRSGRRGQADKEGIAILMHTKRDRQIVDAIEQYIGYKFQHIGPPSVDDIIRSTAKQTTVLLEKIHQDAWERFLSAAEGLLKQHGSRALAAALAHLSGLSETPPSRSLLTHLQGWMTLRLIRTKQGRPLRSLRAVMGALTEISPYVTEKVANLRIINDIAVQGAVFDLPEDTARELLLMTLKSGDMIDAPKELPDVNVDEMPKNNYRRSFEGRGHHFVGRRGGFRGIDDRRRGFDKKDRGSYGSKGGSGWLDESFTW